MKNVKKKHEFIISDEIIEGINYFSIIFKYFINANIFPIKENDNNTIKEENNEDILLIIEIISQDCINFFHLKYLVNIFEYFYKFYINK